MTILATLTRRKAGQLAASLETIIDAPALMDAHLRMPAECQAFATQGDGDPETTCTLLLERPATRLSLGVSVRRTRYNGRWGASTWRTVKSDLSH